MKLCLIAPAPPPFGGVANWEEIVVNEIKKHEDISLKFINIAVNKRTADGRNILDRVFYSGYIMLKAYYQLRRIVKYDPPDVVHMTTSGGLGFFRDLLLLKYLQKKGVFSVYHIHFGRAVKYKAEGKRCWKQIIKAVSIADTTIVIDQNSYEILKPFAKRIEYINNPIDVNKYRKYETIETNTIVYLGEVIKTKGIEELLPAFLQYNQEHNHLYNLEIIGPGNEKYISELKKNNKLINVELLGELKHEEAMKRLARARMLVLPSYTEGFPNVVLEGMVLGKCIIATDVGAIPEMLKDDAGVLIQSHSVGAIVLALEQVLDEGMFQKCGDNARKRVDQEYDVCVTFDKYRKIWETINTFQKDR